MLENARRTGLRSGRDRLLLLLASYVVVLLLIRSVQNHATMHRCLPVVCLAALPLLCLASPRLCSAGHRSTYVAKRYGPAPVDFRSGPEILMTSRRTERPLHGELRGHCIASSRASKPANRPAVASQTVSQSQTFMHVPETSMVWEKIKDISLKSNNLSALLC